MKNIEEIPNEIFDWLNEIPFNKLSVYQKEMVETTIGEQEYIELYNTIHYISMANDTFDDSIKRKIISEFEAIHATKSIRIKFNYWKVASVLFFITSTILLYYSNVRSKPNAITNIEKDTVYIEKPVVKYSSNTVAEANTASTMNNNKVAKFVNTEVKKSIKNDNAYEQNVAIFSIANTPKKRAIKYDSVALQIKYGAL